MLYLWETYPPPAAFLLANLQFFCLYSLLFWANNAPQIIVNKGAVVGVITCFLFMLFLRVADELKDVEVDIVMFPDRPLPSGRVLESDLWIVLIVTLEGMFAINTLYPHGWISFIVLATYAILTFKYFFLEEYIANNLLLAFISHNPLTLLVGFYILSIPANGFKWSLWSCKSILLAVWFWFFGIIWEFTRKIRAPENETNYMTYSRLFGLNNSIYLTSSLMTAQFVIISILAYHHKLSNLAFSILFLTLISCIGYFLMFLKSNNKTKYKIMPAGAVYLFLNLIVLLSDIIIRKGVVWQ